MFESLYFHKKPSKQILEYSLFRHTINDNFSSPRSFFLNCLK